MKINELKHKESLDVAKVRFIDLLALFMGFSTSMLTYVVSTYFSGIAGDGHVGGFYLIAHIIVFVILLNIHKLVRVQGRSFVFQISFVIKIISLAFLVALPVSYLGSIFVVSYIIAEAISWATLNVILETCSKDSESGKIQGLHLAIMNAGFIIGPLLSSQILERQGFSGIFFVILLLDSLVFSLSLFGLRGSKYRFSKWIPVRLMLRRVMKRKDILEIYYVSFALEFFYALMIAYTPIYLMEKGFNWEQMGIAFTIMLIPFPFIQYPMGILADRKTGEREFLILAIALMGISTLAFYFSNSKDIMVWAAILFATRVGAALIEVLRESYFFKRVDAMDVDIINFYKTSKSVAFIVSMGIATVLMFFFSVKAIFLLVAVVTLSALYPAFMLADNNGRAGC